jgi:outer membrane protein TolC
LLADAQARAPQLALVRTRVREAEARRALSDTERAPVPELGGGYVREGSTPVAGPVSHSAILTFAMPVPLWSHNQGRRADARASEAVAHATAAAEAQRLRADVARLHARVASDAQRLDLYTGGLLPKFDEQLAQLERALALGELDLFALTTLRARVLAAQHALVEVRAAYAASLSELERTVGFELPVAGAAP